MSQPAIDRLPALGANHWPSSGYRRAGAPERVLQFGTGRLLRAIAAASVHHLRTTAAFDGAIAAIQSTPRGVGAVINAQSGLFTLVERGLVDGAPVEQMRLVGSLSRVLRADHDWDAVRTIAASADLAVIISNVTEAGFRPDSETAFPARLADLLRIRFERRLDGHPLFVVPTELVDDNGPRLREMVHHAARRFAQAEAFRDWLDRQVRFCSSLVDRITTGEPSAPDRARLEARLGYADRLLTATEPEMLWAIETDPAELRGSCPLAQAPGVVVTRDISFYRERKLRLLNGAHTALAPLALLAGIETVREAADHPRLGALLRRVLFEEIIPSTTLGAVAARDFAERVLERFRNPWLEHRWSVIARDQADKMRIRLVPSIAGFVLRQGRVPEALALCCAGHLRYGRPDTALLDEDLAPIPGVVAATRRWLDILERGGIDQAIDRLDDVR